MSTSTNNTDGYKPHVIDGDVAAKTMDKGASSAMANTEFTDSIFEASKPRSEPLGEKATGAGEVCTTVPVMIEAAADIGVTVCLLSKWRDRLYVHIWRCCWRDGAEGWWTI
jgi:hypothetical protein